MDISPPQDAARAATDAPRRLHGFPAGPLLALGLLALIAVVVQIAAARTLKRMVPLGVEHPPPEQGGKALMLYRISAAMLAFTAVSMVVSRFI